MAEMTIEEMIEADNAMCADEKAQPTEQIGNYVVLIENEV